ncbi:zinc finger BED domain-containing protein RICESLEEPER 2-like [Cynara cardunculus var. scolymus]|uniref:zinc finger BED domain-containing protein RICESLEEPER 2-like n=1 Tax=Cynara cardunculus var. scolymus TaxID=59895 RepID=UPI000D6296A4|nr:zinc finger BED domain-containing protein RICESLEEPER 2-like [Cynara cardunculus var. scolymus]
MAANLLMSDVSCTGPYFFHDDFYLDRMQSPQELESTEIESSANTSRMESTPEVVVIGSNDGDDVVAVVDGGREKANIVNNEESTPYAKRKRKKTSGVWEHFHLVKLANGTEVCECIHYGEKIKKLKDGTTTPLHRHISDCSKLRAVNTIHPGQLKLKVVPGKLDSSMVQNWKFDNSRIREVVSHMIMVHELPFNFVEYELFNVVMKEANSGFNKISRASAKQDCVASYEIGKKRIKKMLNTVNRVSITTDMWTLVQNIHYMVVTCHFVDSDFKLNKCILSFVDVPPPYSGLCIYDSLFKCLKEWNIETKVATLTVDNATTNDVVATKLMKIMNLQKKLVVGGKLFHVRCCAHILNLLVQDSLSEIKDIIHNVRESVKHALEFKEVFVNYADRESTYKTLPTSEGWDKVEVICSFLGLFNEVTKIISGSEYPTSNLFLSELYGIKEALDDLSLDENPRYKMKLVEFSFSSIYSADEASKQMKIVQDTLTKMFEEHVEQHRAANIVQISSAPEKSESEVKSGYNKLSSRVGVKSGTEKYDQHIRSVDTFASVKLELDIYLEEGVYIGDSGAYFDALEWWKEKNLKFRILSKMATDVLAIPITIVASESAFSVGGRVIDAHRASLGTKTVDMLIYRADWYRHHYRLHKKKTKKTDDMIYIELP